VGVEERHGLSDCTYGIGLPKQKSLKSVLRGRKAAPVV
jgi:hypothetical protein